MRLRTITDQPLLAGLIVVIALSVVSQLGRLTTAGVKEGETIRDFDPNPNLEAGAAAPNNIGTVPMESIQNLAIPLGLGDQDKILQSWNATNGDEVLNLLKNADFSDPQVRRVLDKVRGVCLSSKKPFGDEAVNAWNLIAAKHAEATSIFIAQYCGDVSQLVARIDAALAPGLSNLKRRIQEAKAHGVEFAGDPSPERWSNLEKLTSASSTSIEATDALINEGLVERDPVIARNIAERLVPASEGNGTLATWNDYLPPLLPKAERTLVFTIAAELNVCNRSQACGANRPLAMYLCAFTGHRTCQPNEDLLAYRRRTTSPMLYQAAEQIAAAMQARRYR